MSEEQPSYLNDKQKRFCEEYVIDLNATQAAIRAGYSKKTANEQSTRLLTNVHVQNFLNHLKSKIQERTDISVDAVVKELAIIGFSNIEDFIIDDQGNVTSNRPHAMRAVSSIKRKSRTIGAVTEHEVEVKFWNKNDALNQLGKHLGVFEKDNEQKRDLIKSFIVTPASNGKGNKG